MTPPGVHGSRWDAHLSWKVHVGLWDARQFARQSDPAGTLCGGDAQDGGKLSLGLFRTGERCSLGARGPGQRLHVPSVQSSFRETSQGGVGFPQTHSVKLSELGSREAGGLALGSPLSELSPLRPAHPVTID